MTDLIVLAALMRGPAYGYRLKRTAGLIFGSASIHPNVVYPMLKKFARRGWVAQRSAPGERGQTRKQYRITAAGTKHLVEQLQVFGERDAADDGAFLLRVAFFDALPTPARTAIITARESFLKARSAQLSQLWAETRPGSFAAVALGRVRAQVQNDLRWLRKVERMAGSGKGE